MANLKDKAYMDFSGGIRRDVSPITLKNNQLVRGRNFEIDNAGRITKRRGSIQFGQSVGGIIKVYYDNNAFFIANYSSNQLIVYRLWSATNDSATTLATTSLAVTPLGQFTASGIFEIEGDLVTYTAGGGGATMTVTASSWAATHPASRALQQWSSIGTLNATRTNVSTDGVWMTYLNGLTTILSYDSVATPTAVMSTWDGLNPGTIADVATLDVGTRLLETFRDRVFTTGVLIPRVYYSNLGTVAFPTAIEDNSFDIDDGAGSLITSIKQYRKNLIISKSTTMYAYSGSLPVRQLSSVYGVYNENCIQEVEGLLYGFGSKGVFVTNGVSFVDIGKPIKEYLDTVLFTGYISGSDISRIGTAKFDNQFIINLDNLTEPDTGISLPNVQLVYNTVKKSWSVWSGLQMSGGIFTTPLFESSNSGTGASPLVQDRSSTWYSDNTSVYRLFENRHIERTSSSGIGRMIGGDIYADASANATGTPITMNVVTKPFDLGLPHWRKIFGYLKVFCENPQGLTISVSIDGGDPIVLGRCNNKIERFKFPANTRGYRCQVIIDESSVNQSCVFNGVVFEECKTMDQNA